MMVRRRSRLSGYKQNKLLELFVAGTPARTAAELAGVNRHSATLFYHKLREIVVVELAEVFPEQGAFEVDESYFGGVRKGKRGRGAAGKVPVFGILKRGGKVYTQMIPDTTTDTLFNAMQKRILPDSIVYTDCYRSYDILDVSLFHHHRINHSILFARGKNHINGIENFWNHAKRNLRKYNGIPKHHFNLFLKECEFRFNFGSIKQQITTLKRWKHKHLI
jgi:transposase